MRVEAAIEAEQGHTPEERLCRAVIAQAVADIGMRHQYLVERDRAKTIDVWRQHQKELEECLDAVLWLIDPSEAQQSFAWYCRMAGLPWRPKKLHARFKLDLLAIRAALAHKPPRLPSKHSILKQAA